MSKHPVNTSYFDPEMAAIARNKALELADGATDRLVKISPNVYIVMNSATHADASPKVLKRIRKGYGLA